MPRCQQVINSFLQNFELESVGRVVELPRLKFAGELLTRNEEVHSLTAKIRTNEAGESGRQLVVRNTQDQLDSITEQYHRACHRLKESQV